MGYEVNWWVPAGDPVLQHPLYQKHANTTFGSLSLATVKADLSGALADRESASVVAYLSWLVRVLSLLG